MFEERAETVRKTKGVRKTTPVQERDKIITFGRMLLPLSLTKEGYGREGNPQGN